MISIDDVKRARADIAPYVKRTVLEKNTENNRVWS
jgi:hypothetical protein